MPRRKCFKSLYAAAVDTVLHCMQDVSENQALHSGLDLMPASIKAVLLDRLLQDADKLTAQCVGAVLDVSLSSLHLPCTYTVEHTDKLTAIAGVFVQKTPKLQTFSFHGDYLRCGSVLGDTLTAVSTTLTTLTIHTTLHHTSAVVLFTVIGKHLHNLKELDLPECYDADDSILELCPRPSDGHAGCDKLEILHVARFQSSKVVLVLLRDLLNLKEFHSFLNYDMLKCLFSDGCYQHYLNQQEHLSLENCCLVELSNQKNELDIVKFAQRISSLQISFNTSDRDSIKCLELFNNLNSLDVHLTHRNPEAKELLESYVMPYLLNCGKKLRYLYLSETAIDAELVTVFKHCSNLEELYISNRVSRYSGCDTQCNRSAQADDCSINMQHLKSVHLEDLHDIFHNIPTITALLNSPSMEELSIHSCVSFNDDLINSLDLSTCFPELKSFACSYCNELSVESIIAILCNSPDSFCQMEVINCDQIKQQERDHIDNYCKQREWDIDVDIICCYV